MKLCHNCESGKIIYTSFSDPEYLKSMDKGKLIVKNLKPSEMNVGKQPKNADLEIILTQKDFKKGTKLYYWAAEKKSLLKSGKISSAREAYHCNSTRTNYGCTSVKSGGVINFKIMAPQCYSEDKVIYPKHLHFLAKKEKEDSWNMDRVYTVLAIPMETEKIHTKQLANTNIFITPMQVKLNWKRGIFTMVYALDDSKKSLHDLDEYKNFKHLRLPHNKKNIHIPDNIKKSQPMVVYCAHSKCNAAKNLMLKLVYHGYVNLFYMPDGMIGFSKQAREIFEDN